MLSHLPMSNFEFARVQKLTDLRNSTKIERYDKQSCRDLGCFYTLIYEGIQRKNKQTEVQASLLRSCTLQNSLESALRCLRKGTGSFYVNQKNTLVYPTWELNGVSA